MGPHLRARRYAPGDYIIYLLFNSLYLNVFIVFLFCHYFVFFLFYSYLTFISYTSEPAKGTFILAAGGRTGASFCGGSRGGVSGGVPGGGRSEEHTSELQSQSNIVC